MKKIAGVICFVLVLTMAFCACAEEASVRYDYNLADYIELEQLKEIHAPYADPSVCAEEEIDYAVHQIMLSYAEFTPKAEGSVVEQYDKAVVDYKIFQDGQELQEYSQPEYGIVIGYDGNGDIDDTLAKELLGKKVGDSCKISYTFPTNDISLGSWAGATVECSGTIIGIYSSLVPECTDEFVQSLEKFTFQTVQDFREQIRVDTMEQKVEAKQQIVLETFIAGAKVKKYPDAEVKAYVEDYVTDIKELADEMEMDFAQYLEEYMQCTEDEINEAALEDARQRVKNDMACIQACRLLQITLTEEEYQDGLSRYYEQEKENFESIEEFESHYTRLFMEDCIRWDKAFVMMVDDAVSTLEQ